MESIDGLLYEYAVVRYVPRVDRQEFVNIGLIMVCKRRRWLKGRLELNAGRLAAFDPRVDIDRIRHQASIFERVDLPSPELPCEERYRWLAAEKSAVFQVSPSHPGIIPAGDAGHSGASAVELLEAEFNRLFLELVSV